MAPITFKANDTVATAIVIVCGCICVGFLLGAQPRTDLDDLGLFNPIHIWLTTGRWHYPVHWQPDGFTIHPPFRYFEIALLMWAGLSHYVALYVMPLVLTIVATVLLAMVRWHPVPRIAAGFAMVWLWWWMFGWGLSIRPDADAAIGFVAALFSVELARERGFSAAATGFVAVLFSYASSLHYHLALAPAGLAAMLYVAWRSGAFRPALRGILIGCALFFVPYLIYVLFNLPSYQIVLNIGQITASPGRWDNHLNLYHQIVEHMENVGDKTIASIFRWSIEVFGAPILPAIAGFVLWPRTWLVFCTAAPGIAFVMLQSRKWLTYLYPEMFIEALGFALLAAAGLCVVHSVVRRWTAPTIASVTSPAAGAIIAMVVLWWPLHWLKTPAVLIMPHILEEDVARAAAKSAIGNNKLVGGRLGLWYVSGATRWYDLAPDLYWNPYGPLDVRKFLSRFDYVVEHSYLAEQNAERTKGSLAGWYGRGFYKLVGFYFGSNDTISYVRFSAKPDSVVGFVYDSSKFTLTRFDADIAGPAHLIAAFCNRGEPSTPHDIPVITINIPASSEVWRDPNNHARQFFMLALFADTQSTRRLPSTCEVKEAISGRLTPVDIPSLMPLADRKRNVMNFELLKRRLGNEMVAKCQKSKEC